MLFLLQVHLKVFRTRTRQRDLCLSACHFLLYFGSERDCCKELKAISWPILRISVRTSKTCSFTEKLDLKPNYLKLLQNCKFDRLIYQWHQSFKEDCLKNKKQKNKTIHLCHHQEGQSTWFLHRRSKRRIELSRKLVRTKEKRSQYTETISREGKVNLNNSVWVTSFKGELLNTEYWLLSWLA